MKNKLVQKTIGDVIIAVELTRPKIYTTSFSIKSSINLVYINTPNWAILVHLFDTLGFSLLSLRITRFMFSISILGSVKVCIS